MRCQLVGELARVPRVLTRQKVQRSMKAQGLEGPFCSQADDQEDNNNDVVVRNVSYTYDDVVILSAPRVCSLQLPLSGVDNS